MLVRLTTLTALLAGLAVSISPAVAAPPAGAPAAAPSRNAVLGAELPIRAITLYRSGVGSFQRAGSVEGSRTVQLRFETEQMNDILKSLVLLDLDGGKVDAVSYGSREPLERRLRSFGVDISQAPSVPQLLAQLRGVQIELSTSDGAMSGSIMGVENRKTVVPATTGGNPAHFDEPYVTLLTADGIRTVSIARITRFELADKGLNDELNRALAAIAEHRADRVKTVELGFRGDAGRQRRVEVAYVHAMPVWKTSYRLVLPESESQLKNGGKPDSRARIQGWAVVENTTDEDWKDVRLSLASGRPVGFQMDLYSPVFADRPMLPVPVPGALAGRNFEDARPASPSAAPSPAALAANALEKSAARAVGAAAIQQGPGGLDRAESGGFGKPGLPGDPGSGGGGIGGESNATAGEIGEQFLYTLDAPVTIERQRSAMLPILSAEIAARRVSIFNPSDNAGRPLRGLQMTNDSKLHLMPGPVAVYDGGTYAGDAQIPHTSRGQGRLLAYALDVDVVPNTEVKSESNIVSVKIVSGLVEQTFRDRLTRSYGFQNNDPSRARTMIVEHPRSREWELKEPEKPMETTESVYRFEVPVESGKRADLKVVEEVVRRSLNALTSTDLGWLVAISKEGKASPAVVDAVRKAAGMQGEMNALERRIKELDGEREAIGSDQNRIRQNLQTIDRNGDLHARLMKKLNEQETRLEQILSERNATSDAITKKRSELEAYLRDLKVD
ncbi:MAG: hypothetical protein IBJ11_09345 [Phycisphaerales bacterium]|nr:hypothetical protein [Phycisphaerales bacterium]